MTNERGPSMPVIVECTNGPLLVRGDVELRTAEGEPIPRTRRTVALCRCGVSSIKPFCDGSHKLVNFRTAPPSPSADSGPPVGDDGAPAAGGAPGGTS